MPHRVLLVDIDCLQHSGLAEYLEAHGFSLVCVETQEEALEQIRAWRPAVILLAASQARLLVPLQRATRLPVVAPASAAPAEMVAALLREFPDAGLDTRFWQTRSK